MSWRYTGVFSHPHCDYRWLMNQEGLFLNAKFCQTVHLKQWSCSFLNSIKFPSTNKSIFIYTLLLLLNINHFEMEIETHSLGFRWPDAQKSEILDWSFSPFCILNESDLSELAERVWGFVSLWETERAEVNLSLCSGFEGCGEVYEEVFTCIGVCTCSVCVLSYRSGIGTSGSHKRNYLRSWWGKSTKMPPWGEGRTWEMASPATFQRAEACSI